MSIILSSSLMESADRSLTAFLAFSKYELRPRRDVATALEKREPILETMLERTGRLAVMTPMTSSAVPQFCTFT